DGPWWSFPADAVHRSPADAVRSGRRSGWRPRQRSDDEASCRFSPRQTSFFESSPMLTCPGYPAPMPVTPDNVGMADRLTEYRRKRDPARTPEPVPQQAPEAGQGDTFVVQQHHARSLHWDLRLERDGVLVSWAIPRGLPRARPVTTWPCTPRTTRWCVE